MRFRSGSCTCFFFNTNILRCAIEHYLGAHELGIYSALSHLSYAATLFASALRYVAFAKLGKYYYERDIHGFKMLLGKMILSAAGVGLACFLLSVVAGREILAILYKREYATHLDLLLWLVATTAMTCAASWVGVAMTVASQFRPQIPLFLVVGVVSVILSFTLCPPLASTARRSQALRRLRL